MNRQIDHWTRINGPEIAPSTYRNLVYGKVACQIIETKIDFLNKWCWITGESFGGGGWGNEIRYISHITQKTSNVSEI